MEKRSGLALLLVVPALALGACGGDSDKEKITTIIEDVGDEPAKVCEHATKKVLKQVGGTEASCKKAAKGADKDRDVKVKSVDVNGDKAAAKIKGTQGDQTVNFVKEDGDWKVSATR